MNVRDSHIIREKLLEENYIEESPENCDFVVINTCSVRKKAENKAKVYVREYKKKGKSVIVAGCIPHHDEKNLLKIGADIVIGTKNYAFIHKIIKEWQNQKKPESFLNRTPKKEIFEPIKKPEDISTFVDIMHGCDNFCSFCVVPYTRGREVSRDAFEIIEEIKCLVKQGVKEITLIGQNVNSYFDGKYDFAELLAIIEEIPGKFWVKYSSPNPRDFSYKVIKTIKNSEKISRWFHMPLQSGSTKVLKLMKRDYTKEEYLDLINLIRGELPEAVITTDTITGFPGEDEKDFEETLDVVRKVKFDMAFMFKYSRRPRTPASFLKNQLSERVKAERLDKLIKEVTKGILERRKERIGKVYEILILEKAEKYRGYSKGITRENVKILIKGEFEKGAFITCKIKELKGHSLIGENLKEAQKCIL